MNKKIYLLIFVFLLFIIIQFQNKVEKFDNIKIYNSNIPIGPKRPKFHPPKYMGTNQEPWFTRESIIFLYNYIKNNKKNIKVLEYGSGSSTAWFLKNGCEVTSVEHIKKWLDELGTKIPENLKNKWIPKHIEIQNAYTKKSNSFNYDNFVKQNEKMYDIICIDGYGIGDTGHGGSSRVRCLINSIDKINNNGLLVLDNAERKNYKKGIDSVPKNWLRKDFITPVDTTIIWRKI